MINSYSLNLIWHILYRNNTKKLEKKESKLKNLDGFDKKFDVWRLTPFTRSNWKVCLLLYQICLWPIRTSCETRRFGSDAGHGVVYTLCLVIRRNWYPCKKFASECVQYRFVSSYLISRVVCWGIQSKTEKELQ